MMISTSVDCLCLMTPILLLTPQISSLLQSMLHMEVVLGMTLSEHGKQSSPMLQQLLKHADRYSITAVMLHLSVSMMHRSLRGQHEHKTHSPHKHNHEVNMLFPFELLMMCPVAHMLVLHFEERYLNGWH